MNWMSSEVRGAAELGDVFTFRGLVDISAMPGV